MADIPEDELARRLRARDEAAFASIVDQWSPGLLRIARSIVSTEASAAETVQDTWLAVVTGIDAFEGRSSVRTWVHRILINTATRRATREARTRPWSSLAEDGPTVPTEMFQSADEPYPGHWRTFPEPWPEQALLDHEVRDLVAGLVAALPDQQRAVITLRDIEGWSGPEAADLLGLSEGNQRVLLHRARAAVRRGLADFLADPV